MLIPSLVSILWFTVFGGMTLNVADAFSSEDLLAMTTAPEDCTCSTFVIAFPYLFILVLIGISLVQALKKET